MLVHCSILLLVLANSYMVNDNCVRRITRTSSHHIYSNSYVWKVKAFKVKHLFLQCKMLQSFLWLSWLFWISLNTHNNKKCYCPVRDSMYSVRLHCPVLLFKPSSFKLTFMTVLNPQKVMSHENPLEPNHIHCDKRSRKAFLSINTTTEDRQIHFHDFLYIWTWTDNKKMYLS